MTTTSKEPRLKRKLDHATASARQSMSVFRENRKLMGFVHTSVYLPEAKREEFGRFVDRVKAEYMMELLELPPNDPARIALAQCNYAAVPDPSEVHLLYNATEDVALRKLYKKVLFHLESYMTARNGLRIVTNDDEVITFASIAVAQNMMAAYFWSEAKHERTLVNPLEGKDNA